MSDYLDGLAYVANGVACQYAQDAEGMCIITSAVLAWHLTNVHAPEVDVKAVQGQYLPEDLQDGYHWWLEVDGWRVDATRSQFDDGLLVDLLSGSETRYLAESIHPPGWTREHLDQEAARSFVFADAGESYVTHLLDELGMYEDDWEASEKGIELAEYLLRQGSKEVYNQDETKEVVPMV